MAPQYRTALALSWLACAPLDCGATDLPNTEVVAVTAGPSAPMPRARAR
jgi:hypothetical protein